MFRDRREYYRNRDWEQTVQIYSEITSLDCDEWDSNYAPPQEIYLYYAIAYEQMSKFDSTEYVEYSKRIEPGQTYTRTDIKLKEGQTIIGFSNRNSMVSFVCHGQLFYEVSGLPTSDDFVVLDDEEIIACTFCNLPIGVK
mgnify:CR=1 FL=1